MGGDEGGDAAVKMYFMIEKNKKTKGIQNGEEKVSLSVEKQSHCTPIKEMLDGETLREIGIQKLVSQNLKNKTT